MIKRIFLKQRMVKQSAVKQSMVKRAVACCFCAGTLMIGLTGCGEKDQPSETQEDQLRIVEEEDIPEEEPETETGKEEATEDALAESVYNEAYANAIIAIIEEHKLPDGQQAPVEEGFDYEIDKNTFAVADVDEDGVKELVIVWSNQCMAGMVEYVYQYLPEEDDFHLEISEFPGIVFRTGGFATADWSHNQGYGEMWPYTIYEYDPAEDKYEVTGQVDSWNKAVSATGYQGEPYPDDVDKEQAGVVYDITYRDQYTGDFRYSQSDYDDFYKAVLSDKEPLEIKYHKINYAQAEKLRIGELDPVITGKIVAPQVGDFEVYDLPDGKYQAGLQPDNIYVNGDEVSASIEIYQKEIYDIVDMNTLEVGDGIILEDELIRVKEVEEKDGIIYVNGGLEAGGADFAPLDEENCYVFRGDSDSATYKDYGMTYLVFDDNCLIQDTSDRENPEETLVPVDQFADYAKERDLFMSCYNTTIRVENGKVVQMTIAFVP